MKVKIKSFTIFIPVLLALLTGCNNDIFVDAPYLPDDSVVIIEGDGGEAEFSIETKGLKHINIDNSQFVTYYNIHGEIADSDIPAYMLGKIVYDNDFLKFEVIKNGGTLTVRSICNTWMDNVYWTVELGYEFDSRHIIVEIMPGKQLELLDVTYISEMKVTDNAQIRPFRTDYVNDGEEPWHLEMRPWLQYTGEILVLPDDHKGTLSFLRVTMPVPVYENDGWVMKEMQDIQPGSSLRFPYSGVEEPFPVTIPAGSRVSVYTMVYYSGAEASGFMRFVNPVLEREFLIHFTVKSIYPVRYDVHI